MEATYAQHLHPIWRDRSDYILNVRLDAADSRYDFEQLFTRELEDNTYEVCCIPFFARNLALGDIVAAAADGVVREVIHPSGRVTFRILFEDINRWEAVCQSLTQMGCLLEAFSERLIAVDSPDENSAEKVSGYLLEMESNGILNYQTGNR